MYGVIKEMNKKNIKIKLLIDLTICLFLFISSLFFPVFSYFSAVASSDFIAFFSAR